MATPPGLERALPLLTAKARREGRVRGGMFDLLGADTPPSTGTVQSLMLTSVVPQVYERWWRPALGRVFKGVLGPGMADERRIARLLMGLSPGDRVLDVACGTGNFTRAFARTVSDDGLVVGIDVSLTMLDRAVADSAGHDNVAYVRGDAAELPFADGRFDAVCCFAAFHLFADPMRALDRMTSVMAPGGRIALFTTARPRSAPVRTVQSALTARSGARMFEQREVADALRSRGFTDVRRRFTGLAQFVGGRLAD